VLDQPERHRAAAAFDLCGDSWRIVLINTQTYR
jgi:hypothetical protein